MEHRAVQIYSWRVFMSEKDNGLILSDNRDTQGAALQHIWPFVVHLTQMLQALEGLELEHIGTNPGPSNTEPDHHPKQAPPNPGTPPRMRSCYCANL